MCLIPCISPLKGSIHHGDKCDLRGLCTANSPVVAPGVSNRPTDESCAMVNTLPVAKGQLPVKVDCPVVFKVD